MALDLETLLAPVSEETPAGEDLSYDPERAEIERAFESSVSVDASGVESEGAEVDWRRIISLIEAQSGRTKDVWLAVYLCRAGARSSQLAVVETGALYLSGLLETFWEVVHPQLDEYGFQGRKGPCESLTRIGEFLGPLERTALLEHPRLGRWSGADFVRFSANAEAEDGYGQFRAALQDTAEEDLQAIAARIEAISEAFHKADAVLTANAEGDTAPNFKATYDLLAQLKRGVLAFTSAPAAEEEGAGEAEEGGSGEEASSGQKLSGRVESREDVVKAIDAITDYYKRKEPASPVPLVLRRAREWVTLDFLQVLEDIAPSSIDEARRVLASRNQSG